MSSLATLLATMLLLGCAALHTDIEELLSETPVRAALVTFLMVGAAAMHFDYIAFAKEEAKKEGSQCLCQFPLIPLILGGAVALFLALAVVWGQGSTQDVFVDLMEGMHVQATKLPDAINLAIATYFGRKMPTLWPIGTLGHADTEELHDAPIWAGLIIFLLLGAVVMAVDFIDIVRAEAREEGLESFTNFSLIPAGCGRLILGFGGVLPLALAAARCWQVSGQLAAEVTSFFISAALAIGLATTVTVKMKRVSFISECEAEHVKCA